MIILGIETSCDETAAAVIEVKKNKIKILSNIVSSQINIHKKYGGVVPEVAAREHVLNILPIVNQALRKGGRDINAIAVTAGPGLITSLIVGVETAKVLSYVWNVPVVDVNHIEGHIYANFIESQIRTNVKTNNNELGIEFPALILTVSGGHTMLVLMRGHGRYKIIGETRDDAAGEAFDKAAKMLGIGYPGGPTIAAKAAKFKIQNSKFKINLPRPMINSRDYDFSFSGLKTALLYKLKEDKSWKKKIPEYCHEFQQAIIDVLIFKTIKAAQEYKVKTIMLTGGVAANKKLRRQLKKDIKRQAPNTKFLLPDLKYTTDNAAMIATAGYFSACGKKFTGWQKLKADCGLRL